MHVISSRCDPGWLCLFGCTVCCHRHWEIYLLFFWWLQNMERTCGSLTSWLMPSEYRILYSLLKPRLLSRRFCTSNSLCKQDQLTLPQTAVIIAHRACTTQQSARVICDCTWKWKFCHVRDFESARRQSPAQIRTKGSTKTLVSFHKAYTVTNVISELADQFNQISVTLKSN